jgi:EAL domain-containing protein (putative c-di-GMP-specific phosphodiesterase class I)/CheY-like chemotaxis protein
MMTSELRPNPDPEALIRVLLVDDDEVVVRSLSRVFAKAGYSVVTAADGVQAIARVSSAAPDVIVSDIQMPNLDGIAFLRTIRGRDLDVPVIFLTGNPDLGTAAQAVEFGAFRYVTKPVDGGALVAMVEKAAQFHRLALVRREAAEALHSRPVGDLAGLEARFEAGLDAIWMAMQPVLSWRTRSVFAYEALLRTDEPTLRSPLDFVDAAERLRRTVELGRRVRARVADQLIDVPPSVKVFVNLHPSDLVDEELLSRDGVLTPFAHGVVLEVTERAALDRVPDLGAAVVRLRELGYQLALDDLGAGYAGLSSFALLQPEVVKVDMSLVRDIHLSKVKQKVFQSFAELCRDLRTEIVAEGVETVEERDCLNSLGGDLYQGYLFARPGRGFPHPVY